MTGNYQWLHSESTNQIDLDLDRFVRRDRSRPMKNVPTDFYVITSIMGKAYKNLSMKSDFSHMPLSRSGFDSEREAFCTDLKPNDFKKIGFIGSIECLILNEPNDN